MTFGSFYGQAEIVALSHEGGAYVVPARIVHDEIHCGLVRRVKVEYLTPKKLAELSTPEMEIEVGSLLR